MAVVSSAGAEDGWSAWNPPRDDFRESAIDLRPLNEKVAGQNGRVRVEDGRFVLGNGKPVRFWGVNGPPTGLKGEELRRCARMLAKRGVNLVRIHGAAFDKKTGELKPETVAHFHEVVAAMKAEGIYTHLSIYFPLWFTPQPDLPFLQGYDGSSHPFAALFINREFQQVYEGWWKAILTTPGPDGKSLLEDPAVLGLELVNEDSYFFWTFSERRIPRPQMELLEREFADWVVRKYGSLEEAYQTWDGLKLDGDTAERLRFRGLQQIFSEKTPRDRDTATFLFESQRGFYQRSVDFLRDLGFEGLITASNWTTANNRILGPLERASYAVGDFIDRHGYFAGVHEGENAAWSIREGHTYSHRSAIAFDGGTPGGEKEFAHPVFDLTINGMPSMISETTFPRPNRHRTEGPLFYACYGALQGSDSIVHFALDGADWSVKPRFHMQPWTLMSPTMMGQFPAAALIYRLGLIAEGEMMAEVTVTLDDAKALKGSPFLQKANLDELRKADTNRRREAASGGGIDPRVHLIGRTRLNLADEPQPSRVEDFRKLIDDERGIVTSSTGELRLDSENRLLRLESERAQGAVGDLKAAGILEFPGFKLKSELEVGAIVLVSLDGKSLETSGRMLLQAMSEERPSGFKEEAAGEGRFRITALGRDPWLIRELQGHVALKRPDAKRLRVTALDGNGYPAGEVGTADLFELRPDTAYYLIAP